MGNEAGGQGQEPGNQQQTNQGQAPGGQNGNQGQEPGAGGQQNGGQFDPSTITDPAMRSYLEKVQKDAEEARREAARYRTERNAFESQVTQQQRQNETDEQRQQREQQERDDRNRALEQENRDLKVGGSVRAAADKAKAFNSETVYGLIKDKVVLDSQGTPANVDDLIADLKRDHPYLFKRAKTDAGEGGGDGNQTTVTMNDAIRAAAGRTTIAQ